jgi:peroxiredoxin
MSQYPALRLVLLLIVLALPLAAGAVDRGDPLPVFQAQSLKGESIDLRQLVGKKPVLLVFWASWCPSCRQEMPTINALHERLAATGLQIIGINAGYNDSEQKAKRFLAKYHVDYPNVFDGTHRLTTEFQVVGVPTIVLADGAGIIRYKGNSTPELDEAAVRNLLGD